ncbi:hypothetical protein ACJMK2_035208 [Sinanodonta woodiana]|uniref:CSD domain-containing protein n=1 Tax=Sinanodonta woodiana TaxID=1069815 RepID=A0ABD3WY81_SINWO
MSSASNIPHTQATNNTAVAGSPDSSHRFLLPSPIPTRRDRTYSASERALEGPTYKGVVKTFCRQRGHGFIVEEVTRENMFVHISDVEGEYVPKEGDEVTFKKVLIPPKNEKYQACHVKITHLAPGVSHETWDSPSSSPRS